MNGPKRIAILKTGSTRLEDSVRRRGGDYDRWFAQDLAALPLAIEVIDAVAGPLPEGGDWDGLIITGSPASVHDREPWSEAAGRWVAARVGEGLPTLGVCYGHQLLADCLGGDTGPAKAPEIGQFPVELLADDPLFEGFDGALPVFLIHYDEVTELPPGARVLARSARCPVQAFAIGGHVRAVQWHPEFDASGVREAIDQDADRLKELGDDPDALKAGVQPQPDRARILTNFVTHFVR